MKRLMQIIALFFGGIYLGMFPFSDLYAHEEGAPFSGAIIEPLEVHHAHIEDEQKFNLFFLDGAPIEAEPNYMFCNKVCLELWFDRVEG